MNSDLSFQPDVAKSPATKTRQSSASSASRPSISPVTVVSRKRSAVRLEDSSPIRCPQSWLGTEIGRRIPGTLVWSNRPVPADLARADPRATPPPSPRVGHFTLHPANLPPWQPNQPETTQDRNCRVALEVNAMTGTTDIDRYLAYFNDDPSWHINRRTLGLAIRPFGTDPHEVGPNTGLPNPGTPRTAESYRAKPPAAPADSRKDEQPEDHNRPHRPGADPVGRNQLALPGLSPRVLMHAERSNSDAARSGQTRAQSTVTTSGTCSSDSKHLAIDQSRPTQLAANLSRRDRNDAALRCQRAGLQRGSCHRRRADHDRLMLPPSEYDGMWEIAPPSMQMSCPVMNDPSSDTRKATRLAMSSGCPGLGSSW